MSVTDYLSSKNVVKVCTVQTKIFIKVVRTFFTFPSFLIIKLCTFLHNTTFKTFNKNYQN